MSPSYGATVAPLSVEEQSMRSNGLPKPVRYQDTKLHKRLQTLAGVAGNVLEWYDFAVFGTFANVLGKVFFPAGQSEYMELMESFMVFGGAFLMRPIGGILMGHLGDVYGRKTALEVSIFLMAVPTFLMGCLPTYEQVGMLSTILLILIRCLQGLSVGGQLMSSLVFTLESRPHTQWGVVGSYVMATATFGTLMGSVVGFVIHRQMSPENILSYGWRLPFLSGILIVICGLYLRYYGDEGGTPGHHDENSKTTRNPLQLALRPENLRQLGAACLVSAFWSGGFWLTFLWMAIFMSDLIPHPMKSAAFEINSISLFASICLLFPIAGALSDKYGRRCIMTMGGVAMGCGAPFLVRVIGAGTPGLALMAQCMLGVCLSFWGAPMMAWLVEYFPPEARLTSAAVGYNVGQAIVGGVTPTLATYMVENFGYQSPGWLLTGLASIAVFGLWFVAPEPPSNPIGSTDEKQRLLYDRSETESVSDESLDSV